MNISAFIVNGTAPCSEGCIDLLSAWHGCIVCGIGRMQKRMEAGNDPRQFLS